MTHVHHIVPRHMGGTDEPSNLIELTVEEHAEAHRVLYETYGKKEDYIAWKGLSKQIGKEEIFKETSSLGGNGNAGKPKSEEHRRKISQALKGKYGCGRGVQSEEIREKIRSAMTGNTNSKNHSSEEYRRKQSEAMKKAWAKRKANKRP